MIDEQRTKRYLDLAARVASRGLGLVEPNPMVGAVIVGDNRVIGVGHHRRYGTLHAERDAIANCRARGHDPAGATLYCTLEPCSHHGKQPPCTEAIIEAGIGRVVIARRDPNAVSRGGCEILTRAGVEVLLSDASINAMRVSDPFLHRLATGRPWVIAKWAQTIDGRVATRTGESQWISGPACRRRVHRLRAKVDAILIGVGTAIADDPMLTARDCPSVRRIAKRVVLDTHGRLGLDSRLVATAGEIPTLVYTAEPDRFMGSGCEVIASPTRDGRIDLVPVLEQLRRVHGVSTLLVESGPTLLGSLFEHELIDEAVVHVAPSVMGDDRGRPAVQGRVVTTLGDLCRFDLVGTKAVDRDVELWYRRAVASGS